MSGRRRGWVVRCVPVLLLVFVSGCAAPFLLPQALRDTSSLSRSEQSQNRAPDDPEIDVNINAVGGDSINVYFEGSASVRFGVAQAAARWLGAEGTPPTPDDFEPDVATVQLDRRLVTRSGDSWTLSLDTSTLHEGVDALGYDTFYLFVCHPAVRTVVRTSRPPDFGPDESYCVHGVGFVVDSEPLHIAMTMLPRTSHYLGYVAGVVLGVVLFSALSWFVGDKLRRTAFRRRSPAAIVIGVGVSFMFGGGAVIATAVVGGGLGPADNLALAKDLGTPAYAGSIAGPSLLMLVPVIIFAVLMVRRRPWREEPIEILPRPWPAPPPPGSGADGPPPLPTPR